MHRRPVLAYFALAFAISWGGILALLAATPDGADAGRTRLLIFPLMLAGPALASVGLTAALDGSRGLRELFERQRRWRAGARWAATLLIAPAILLAVLALSSLSSPASLPALLTGGDVRALAVLSLVGGLAAGFFEELGWTGFATPRLLERHGAVATGLIIGVPWGVWHSLSDHAITAADYGPLWAAHMLQWVIALTAFRVLMTWVYAHVRSLPLGQLLHASFTGSQLLLWPAGPARDTLGWYGWFAAVLCGVAIAVAILERTHARRPEPVH